MVYRVYGDTFEQFLGHVFKVLGILPRNDNMFQSARHTGQDFFLDAAHGQHPALKGNFAGHAQVSAYAVAVEGRNQGCGERYACRRAILGRGPCGHVHMDVVFRHEGRIHSQFFSATAYVAQGGLGAFFHDIAQLTCKGEAALALHHRGFHSENFPAGRGPGQAQSHAGHEFLFFFVFNKAGCAQQLFHICGADPERPLFAFSLAAGQFAAYGGQLALQVAQARFARVLTYDFFQGRIVQRYILFLQAVFLDLFRQKMLAGDLGLFLHGVAGQGDDLHAVAQGGRDGFQMVGRTQEHDLGKIKGHVQVMVAEGVVLFRVQHFQQSG